MKVMVGGRQTGKTTTLIHEMAKYPYESMMICASRQSADNAERMAKNMYPSIEWRERFVPFTSRSTVRGFQHVFVDDVDLVLNSMLGTKPEAVSVTGELFDTEEQERLLLREALKAEQG